LTKGEKYVILKAEERRQSAMVKARFFLSSSKKIKAGEWGIIALCSSSQSCSLSSRPFFIALWGEGVNDGFLEQEKEGWQV